jgi:hypothetical protein
MIRLILLVLVVALAVDAIGYDGTYSKSVWDKVVDVTGTA